MIFLEEDFAVDDDLVYDVALEDVRLAEPTFCDTTVSDCNLVIDIFGK